MEDYEAEDIVDDDSSNEDPFSLKMFTGDIVSVMSTVAEMFNFYKFQFEEGKSPISYLEEGGEARNLLEAYGFIAVFYILFYINTMALMYFLPHSTGDFLDTLGRDNLRKPASKSRRELLFYFPNEVVKDYPVTIPAYTVAFTEDDEGLEFETTEEVVLEAGQNNISAPAQSVYGGSEYNVGSNLVTLLEDEIDDLEVTNPYPFIGAVDDEDDESYRARLLEEKRDIKFGSIEWYKYAAEKIEGVHDVNAINCIHGDHTVGIIVNPSVDDIINSVTDFFSSPSNIPGGNTNYVYGATPINIDLIIENITFASGINPQDGIEEIETQLLNFFSNFTIEKEFLRSDVLTLLSRIDGLIDYSLIAPAEDMKCDVDHVFTAGKIDLRRV